MLHTNTCMHAHRGKQWRELLNFPFFTYRLYNITDVEVFEEAYGKVEILRMWVLALLGVKFFKNQIHPKA